MTFCSFTLVQKAASVLCFFLSFFFFCSGPFLCLSYPHHFKNPTSASSLHPVHFSSIFSVPLCFRLLDFPPLGRRWSIFLRLWVRDSTTRRPETERRSGSWHGGKKNKNTSRKWRKGKTEGGEGMMNCSTEPAACALTVRDFTTALRPGSAAGFFGVFFVRSGQMRS